jgi:hypothetical protein
MTADEILAELAKCGTEASGVLVAQQLFERARRTLAQEADPGSNLPDGETAANLV